MSPGYEGKKPGRRVIAQPGPVPGHYTRQGDYWPPRQRYGLLQITGYSSGGTRQPSVVFTICDLANCASDVVSRVVIGKPGSDRVQALREKMCEQIDRMNRADREHDREQAT